MKYGECGWFGVTLRVWRINLWIAPKVFTWIPETHFNKDCCWFWFCWGPIDFFIDQPDSYYEDDDVA